MTPQGLSTLRRIRNLISETPQRTREIAKQIHLNPVLVSGFLKGMAERGEIIESTVRDEKKRYERVSVWAKRDQ